MDIVIRPIERKQIPEATQVLAIAFDTDPVMRHLWPNPQHRRWALPRYFRTMMTRHHVPGGGVEVATADSGDIVGVALWNPPGRWDAAVPEFIRSAPHLALALGHRIPVALRTRGFLDRIHPHELHWYLCNLAVLPACQRQGVGSALLRSGCARCDATGQAAYLVCTREENVPLYSSAGFATITRAQLPGGTPLWPMWRETYGSSR